MCKQSIHWGDWRPFGMAIFDLFTPLWPVSLVAINCWPPSPHRLMESPCMSYEHDRILSQTCTHSLWNKHTQAYDNPPPPPVPQSINIAFSTSGTSSEERWSGSITACLVYWRWGYVLIRTMSHCHFDLTQGSSTGRYHTFVKYYLTLDISSIQL